MGERTALVPDDRAALRVRACPHPFGVETAHQEIEAGGTLADIVALVAPKVLLRDHAHVWIGDHYIARENWARVRPKPGQNITVRAVPGRGGGGGGKSPLRTILTIAVIAASYYMPQAALAGKFGAGMQGFVTGASGQLSLGGAVLSAATPYIGAAIIGASEPPRRA